MRVRARSIFDMIAVMALDTLVPSIDEYQAVAIHAAQEAGAILEDYARSGFQVEYKNPINLVTDADRAAERHIIRVIHARYPDHRILAEEGGPSRNGPSPFQWVIDPLDGTTNYTHRFPVYCVSIGLEYRGACVLGVVYDPTRHELFTAQVGRGAFLNGSPIAVSGTQALDGALLVTGFAYNLRDTSNNNLNHFNSFALKAQGLRRTGSAALDLSYVAAGRFDGFWEVNLNPWDMAAGVVLVREAGGTVTSFGGGPHSIYERELVASNGLVHESMLQVLRTG